MTAASSESAPALKPPSLIEPVADGWLALDVCADDIVRVAYAKDQRFFQRPTLATAPRRCSYPPFEISLDEAAGTKTLRTAKLAVRIERASGRVTFLDHEGQPILAERSRTLTPVSVQGESTFELRQEWEPNDDEALYGLGQHQQGLMNIDGVDLDLRQYNTEIFVPFLVSSRGYGILWDNTSFTRFGDLGAFTLYEDDGQSYEYERGALARIPLTWTDESRTLTLGAREGSFPGMLEARSIEVVLVSTKRALPFSFRSAAQKVVRYEGAEVQVRL